MAHGAPPPYFGNPPGATALHAANAPYPPAGGIPQTVPLSKIELKISCRNLVDMDVFSKSDPFCVVYLQSSGRSEWIEIGRTETIMDNLDPDFVKSFIIDYYFEERQMLKVEVYDSDSDSRSLTQHDFIGKLVTSLGSIVGENGGRFQHALQIPTAKDKERNDNFSKKSPGTIIVETEEVSTSKDVVVLHLCGKKLEKMDFFGKSDPFLTFERSNENASYSVVHKTEVIKNNLNPTWLKFKVPAQTLCNGDYDRTLVVKCWDWERDGSNTGRARTAVNLIFHRVIGQFETTVNDLVGYRDRGKSHYELVNIEKRKKKKSYKNSGTIHILECSLFQKPTFLDFIRGGLEMSFVVAIDFTASNGDPRTPQSLHHNTQYRPSQYVQALQAVGGVLEDYDTDKLFPAFGFGAKLPPHWNVSHEFALNFNPANPNCHGIDGIVAAYFNTLHNVQLYGPTNFSPIINSAGRIAREHAGSSVISQYFILLIITDGIITDMEKTKEAIVEAASLPLSIIIIGVGNTDFSAMEELDGDDVRLSYRGREAERDIVQFVPFRDYMKGDTYDPIHGVRLAKDVLHELPDQLIEYMEKRNIKPNQPHR